MSLKTSRCVRPLRFLVLAGAVAALASVPAVFAQAPSQTAPGGGGAGEEPVRRSRKPEKPPPVNLVVRVGHDNTTREGHITPVQVDLANNEEGFTGRIELRSFGPGAVRVTDMPIDLPKGGQKQYTLFARLNRDDTNAQLASGELLVFSGRRMIAREVLTPSYVTDAALVLSASGEGAGLQFVADDEKFKVVHRPAEQLPTQWPGYEPADLVALNGTAWSAMSDDQKRALRIWVERGGKAILCGERTAEWSDPEGRALAGVVPTEIASEPRLDCVAELGGTAYEGRTGSILTLSGPLNTGAIDVRREGNRPLIVVRSAVHGRVVWLGFDPFRENLRVGWDGYFPFWERLIELARGGTEVPELPPGAEEGRQAAASLPKLPAPPLLAVGVFGVVYAVIFGPLNIWVLRRLRRTVKSWLFMPALALGMTLLVLFVGQRWGNARIVLNSLSVLSTSAGGRTASEYNYVGLFSPTNRSFDLAVDDAAPELADQGVAATGAEMSAGAVAEASDVGGALDLSWPTHQEDGTVRWDAVALQLFSVRLLEQRRPRDLGGSLEIRLDGRLAGTVKNGTQVPLRNAYLYRRRRYQMLGELQPGTQVQVDADKWVKELEAAKDLAGTGAALENRRFQESVARLWSSPESLILGESGDPAGRGGRNEAWLVAECPDYRGGLEVDGVSFNNRGALLVVRIPRGYVD